MVQITINIKKRHLFLVAIVAVLFAGLGYVVGYGTSNPATFGHTLSELSGGTATNPEYGYITGAMKVSGNDVIDTGIPSVKTAVDIRNTGALTSNALVVHGDTIIYPESDQPSTEDVMLTIGLWDFKALTNGRLCVRIGAQPVGYFQQGVGWTNSATC